MSARWHDFGIRIGDTVHHGREGAWTLLFVLFCIFLPGLAGFHTAIHLPLAWPWQMLCGIAASIVTAAVLLGIGYLAGEDR